MSRGNQSIHRTMMKNFGILVLSVGSAVLIRKFILGALETRIVWVTFYPMVMLAALYGDWLTSVLSSIASCLIVIFAWGWLAKSPFIKDSADWLVGISGGKVSLHCHSTSIAVASSNRIEKGVWV